MADDHTTENAGDATAIWDKRYEGDEHVGTRPVIESDPIDYTQHKFLYERAIARPQTGALDGYNLDRIGERYLKPNPGRMLALGVGMAFTEEHVLRHGYADHVLAYEMSRQAVERARVRFDEGGLGDRIELRAADVLEDDLPDAAFDVVFVQAAIHHFDRIEDMFRLMHRVLKPGGLLVYDEYVGPDHHMYHPEVMAIIDEIDACLAPGYRHDHLAGRIRENIPPPSLEWMLQHDPSEGVHASRILPLTYQYFDVLDRADYGGTLVRPFFTGILRNFDWTDPKDQTVGALVVLIEKLLCRHGVVPSYQTSVVARKREQPRAPLSAAEEARIAYADWPGLAAAPAPGGSREPSAAPQPLPESPAAGLGDRLRRLLGGGAGR
ncbi:class I SAM-dependent methyltransferase [Rhizosaccharibacter radicis]|uniref:Class I SAM-dependent methyltransferase n=1 Tax=Rhizosaccharibacter radicis TaxID=2782605 RepID=A0ABT1VV95_9PROT|nr:class I SAM-dependent methyltransferase [Acetobacteraceae bacterium KSS12]